MRADKNPVTCPHCGREFFKEFKLKIHLKARRAKGGICPLENRHRYEVKRPCPFCKRKLSPAGLGSHLKRREVIGKCPTREKRIWKKKKVGPRKRLDNWTLEDCELIP